MPGKPDSRLVYVGERGGKFTDLASKHALIEKSYHIFAGKFRRYHGESWLRRLTDLKTNLRNLRDGFFVFIGFWQALCMLLWQKPDVIFIKGGFVAVPVGLAAPGGYPRWCVSSTPSIRSTSAFLICRIVVSTSAADIGRAGSAKRSSTSAMAYGVFGLRVRGIDAPHAMPHTQNSGQAQP